MNVDYLKGDESPTAELIDKLFASLDAKLTTLLGGRSFFLAQTAVMPKYLIGKAFFFTAGPAVYAPRVPGYIETNTATKPVARPYNHAQFVTAQAAAVLQPATIKNVTIRPGNGGINFLLNDTITMFGGTVAPGGQPCSVQVTLKDAGGQILAITTVNPGSYTVPPPTPNTPVSGGGGHGLGATFDLAIFQYDVINKVAPVVRLTGSAATTAYAGLPQAADVGLYEWSLAAHSVLHQSTRDARPVRYYLQDGDSVTGIQTTPEKHLRFALAEIIIEGVTTVTIEKSWDKYSCFRVHNLNAHAATLAFAEGYTVNLAPFECATVRRDLDGTDKTNGTYTNYRRGKNYFFTFEGGDPRFYWFMPTTGSYIGNGGRAANSMQANNLANPAILFDWFQYFQRTPDALTVFAAWKDDPSVQCDIGEFYGLGLKHGSHNEKLFGDPANGTTLIGDLLHHKGEIKILRASMTKREPVTGNPLITWDSVTFNGYATIIADFAKKKLQVTENAAGNLVVVNVDPDNDVFLIPTGTNLFKAGDNIDGNWVGHILGWPDNPNVNNGSGATDKGIPLLSSFRPGFGIDLAGGWAVTIESAIFETFNPERSWLVVPTVPPDDPMLAATAPQLIQHPRESISTPQRFWYDIYRPLTTGTYYGGGQSYPGHEGPVFGNMFFEWTVNGSPQTWLDWNTNARGLLTVPTILDGGSGYAVDDEEQLIGGTGDPAVVTVTSVTGGYVTGLRIAFAGNYSSAPTNPNFPDAIWPVDENGRILRRGHGLKLGGIDIPVKTMAGIHKTTVADLLKLDWWGDPRAGTGGNQNSNHVVISERKLTLTPHGLVLTFLETDSPLPGDGAGQPASLPTWASGKRGIPRQRAIRFRGHGWGFVGGPGDTEVVGTGGGAFTISVPPSAKSGMVSPRYGRFEVAGICYKGEGVAPGGKDFSTSLKVGTNGTNGTDTLKLLTRVKAATLTLGSVANARFWTAAKIDNAANFLPQIAGAPAPYFFEVWEFFAGASGYPAHAIAMGLLPEMYNALARAVNALTTGTPLQWQCLFFNVGGYVTNLDPQFSITGIERYDGATVSFVSGYPLPVFNGLGQLVSQEGGNGYAFYTGPRPLDQFGAFDQGSLYERLCNQLGILIRSENDLPGGFDENGKGARLNYFQTRHSAPAVYFNFVTAHVTSAGCAPNPPEFVAGGSHVLDQFSGTYQVTLSTELLSTAALLSGAPTGSKCLGTYDPNGAYPDFTNTQPGQYYVSTTGNGWLAFSSGTNTDAFYYGTPGGVDRSPKPPAGIAYGDGITESGTLNLATAFTGYRWVSVEDIRAVVLRFGFPFLWSEVCTPLVLQYFQDATAQDTIADQSTVNAAWSAVADGRKLFQGAGNSGYFPIPYPLPPGYDPSPAGVLAYQIKSELEDVNALNANTVAIRNSGLPGHGTLIKFCVTNDRRRALWKIRAKPAASTQAVADGPVSGWPAEICNVSSRVGLSPLFRYLAASAGIGLTGNGGPGGLIPNWWEPSLGVAYGPVSILPGVRPSSLTHVPQLAVQYKGAGEMFETGYQEGSLLDQRQVLAFNIYASFPIAPLPVLLSGVHGWAKQKDFWSNMDTAYAASGEGGGAGPDDPHGAVPWSFVPPAPSLIHYVTEYFDGSNQNGLTIFEAKADQRYWCCFSTALFDLNAVTFGSEGNFNTEFTF